MSTALGYRAAGYGADHGIGRGMAMGARLVNVNSRFLDCFVWTTSGCIGGSADGTMAGVLADGDAPTPNVAPWTVCASAGSVSQAAPPRVAQVAGPPEGCDAPPPPVLPPLLPLPAAAPPPVALPTSVGQAHEGGGGGGGGDLVPPWVGCGVARGCVMPMAQIDASSRSTRM